MKRYVRTSLSMAIVWLVASAFNCQASANVVTLQSLLDGGSIVSGDKLFTNFTSFSSFGFGGADAAAATNIFVAPFADTTNSPGLAFQTAVLQVNSGQAQLTSFQFDVFQVANLDTIIGAELRISGFSVNETGELMVDENISEIPNPPIGGMTVSASESGSTIVDQLDWSNSVGALSGIRVSKAIALFGGNHPQGEASLSFFTQRFAQVPEPTSFLMFGVALFGFAGRRKSS